MSEYFSGSINPELTRNLEDENKPPSIDALIVFGEGPVKKDQIDTHIGWGLPVGAKARCIAAAELFNKGQIREIILTGGKTGGENYPSEAELMKRYLVNKFNIPEIALVLEDKSTNTIENFAHVLNLVDSNKDQYQNLSFLSAGFHLARVEKLAKKFLTEGNKFSAQELIKDRSTRHNKWVEKTTDPNKNESYKNTLLAENKWTRALEQIPGYWLPNASYANPERLKAILKALPEAEQWLKENNLANWEDLDPEQMQQKIREIKRTMPPSEWQSDFDYLQE